MDLQFTPVNDGKRTHENIVDQIKEAIFSKKFSPGDRLPSERELSKIFNTSRVTIRQAILTLKNSGLLKVKIGTGGGTFVSEDMGESEIIELIENVIKWNRTGINDVVQLREMIEPQVAYLAAQNATPEDIKMIWAAINDPKETGGDPTLFANKNECFHKALAKAAGNPILAIFQAAMIDIYFKFVHKIKWETEEKDIILSNHAIIAKQIEDHDPEGAKNAMTHHLQNLKIVLSKLTEEQFTIKHLNVKLELKT